MVDNILSVRDRTVEVKSAMADVTPADLFNMEDQKARVLVLV